MNLSSFPFKIHFIDIYDIQNFFFQKLMLVSVIPCKHLFYYLL